MLPAPQRRTGSLSAIALSEIRDKGDLRLLYGIYLNPHYEDGKIYFHGAKAGHKADALWKDARAPFSVIDEGVKDEDG